VVAGLRSLGVLIRKREVQIELTNLVEEATALARQVVSAPGRDIERSEFVRELGNHHRLGQVLPPAHFEQLFTTIVLARYRYRSDRWEDDLVSFPTLIPKPRREVKRPASQPTTPKHHPVFPQSTHHRHVSSSIPNSPNKC
jgi:hypothetical protein